VDDKQILAMQSYILACVKYETAHYLEKSEALMAMVEAQNRMRDAMLAAPEVPRELAEYKAAAPLCAKHQPTGGARANCLVCAAQELSAAISRIDYELGEPNEMQVSGYDVHCNPEPVIVGARNVRRELAKAREALQHIAAIVHTGGLRGLTDSQAVTYARQLSLPYWDGTGSSIAMGRRVDAAIDAAMAEPKEVPK
jgi:hypothetical protein